jgi:hypothetical protein
MQEYISIGARKNHELRPSIVVVSSCQVQETTILALNVPLKDVGLQSAVEIST